ncbi:MAG: hypothetical protein KDI07_05300 [Anaerolineae bacterium]|nr:hypothetical protein [Anaerolineae bacterium]
MAVNPITGQSYTNGAEDAYLSTLISGERNPDSATNSYLVVKPEANATRADIGTTETLITAAPAHLLGVIPNDANTGYLDIIDAAATASGNTPVFRVNLGDGGAAGVAMLTGIAARFENGICVDGEDVACDVTILWRPI